MNEEQVRNKSGMTIGYIRTMNNGDQYGYDRRHREIGRYIKTLDRTEDRHHSIVSKGNTLVALVFEARAFE